MPKISETVALWLEAERKLSRETLALLPVASGTIYFPDLSRKSEGVFFGYDEGWKARAIPDKAFIAAKGWKPSFWNLKAVLDALNSDSVGFSVFITEGEIDAVSLVESGIPSLQVLSVPTGASGSEKDNLRGVPYAIAALESGLNRAKKIIWCGDTDEVGLALRAQMAHQFGAAKFWFVDWPEGIKDANDLLKAQGPDALRNHVLTEAKPWPTTGIYRLSEIPDPPTLTLWEPEIECLKGKVWLAPSTVSLVTGHPGHGKSTFFGQLLFEIIAKYNLVGCFASFETRPKPYMRRQIRTLFHKTPEYQLTSEEISLADRWIDEHYLFVTHPEQRPSLGWFLDMAEIAVVRHGAQILQIDPWNRLEASRNRDESETEYIGRCLRTLAVFAVDMNCHVQIICHPAKMESLRRGRAPELEDCSGCYSDDTEVLTKRGWLKHSNVSLDDDVACFDLSEELLQWEKPSKIWNYDYDGEMHRHRYRGGDLLVTPNHRMVARPGWHGPSTELRVKYKHGKWQFLESASLFGGKWLVPQSAYWIRDIGTDPVPGSLDGGYPSVAFWSYLGWWISEGSVSAGRGISVCQAEKNAEKLKILVSEMDLDAHISTETPKPGRKGTLTMWKATVRKRSHPELTNWVSANCGIGCANKKIPCAAWDLPIGLKIVLWDALMAGDGHAHRSGWSYATNSPQLADDVQRLAIELGYTAQLRKLPPALLQHHGQRYQININGRSYSALHPYRNSTIEQYRGKVWCLTVPTGAYVTRRNGRASICGNSKNWDNMVDQGFVIHRPRLFDEVGNRMTKAMFIVRKSRFDELGYPLAVNIDYDLNTKTFIADHTTDLTPEA